MSILAAACGILLVVLGFLCTFLSTSKVPSDAQFAIQVICLVGGLIICFLSIVLWRLGALARRLDEFEASADAGE